MTDCESLLGGRVTFIDSRRIWSILVNHAGASDHDSEWVSFRQWFDVALAEGRGEYRFMGLLGFGGKFWVTRDDFHVSCYPEDITPDRESAIRETNLALARLMESQ